jgi:hypothetical protein
MVFVLDYAVDSSPISSYFWPELAGRHLLRHVFLYCFFTLNCFLLPIEADESCTFQILDSMPNLMDIKGTIYVC